MKYENICKVLGASSYDEYMKEVKNILNNRRDWQADMEMCHEDTLKNIHRMVIETGSPAYYHAFVSDLQKALEHWIKRAIYFEYQLRCAEDIWDQQERLAYEEVCRANAEARYWKDMCCRR